VAAKDGRRAMLRFAAAHYVRVGGAQKTRAPIEGRKTGFLGQEKIACRAISRPGIEIKFCSNQGVFSPRQIDHLTIVKSTGYL
jgi:hypothetical protein